jgi:hypothetical protein
MSPVKKGVIFFFLIMVIWAGVFVLIYYNTNLLSGTAPTTTPTQTTTTTTPTTTLTPTSNLSQSEQAYINTITDHSARVTTAITSLSGLLTNPQIDNTTWVSQATAQTVALRTLYDEMEQVSTPYSMFAIHYNYLYALSAYKSAAEAIDLGIADQNINSIQQAVSFMNSGTSLLNDSITMLNEFIAEHS